MCSEAFKLKICRQFIKWWLEEMLQVRGWHVKLGAESPLSCPSTDVTVSFVPHLLHAPWSTSMISCQEKTLKQRNFQTVLIDFWVFGPITFVEPQSIYKRFDFCLLLLSTR